MDIRETNDVLSEVLNEFDQINGVLYSNFPDSQPQVFTSSISNSDILFDENSED